MAIGRTIAQVAAGPIASAVNKLLADEPIVWTIKNVDTDEEPISGQFGPIDLTENVGSEWVEHTSLNRTNPITQYLRGTPDTITFGAFFFANHEGPPTDVVSGIAAAATFSVESFVASDDTSPGDKIAKLKEWVKKDDSLGRPPYVSFEYGDGNINLARGRMSLGEIRYFRFPKKDGGIRGVQCAITIRAVEEFSLEPKPFPLTRYHRAKEGDYYEMLAYREYGDPKLGDVIRRLHPDKQVIAEGDVIMLPSAGAIKREVIEPKSTTFKNSFGTKDTPQRNLRNETFERTNQPYFSVLVPIGL